MVSNPTITLTLTGKGRGKLRGLRKTVKQNLERDMENLSEQTQQHARKWAPRNTGTLREWIRVEKKVSSDNLQIWGVVSKNPVPHGGAGYRRGGGKYGNSFNLAYWFAKSPNAESHRKTGRSARYMQLANEWYEKERNEYVRSGKYKRKLDKYKR